MSRSIVLAWLFLLCGDLSARAQAPARAYRNEAMGVLAFRPPLSWEMAPQSSFPRILASYSFKDGRLTLSGEHVDKSLTAQALVDQSRGALVKQGFSRLRTTPAGDRIALDAELDGGKRFVHQLYIIDQDVALVITTVAPLADKARTMADFDEAVRSLQLK